MIEEEKHEQDAKLAAMCECEIRDHFLQRNDRFDKKGEAIRGHVYLWQDLETALHEQNSQGWFIENLDSVRKLGQFGPHFLVLVYLSRKETILT